MRIHRHHHFIPHGDVDAVEQDDLHHPPLRFVRNTLRLIVNPRPELGYHLITGMGC